MSRDVRSHTNAFSETAGKGGSTDGDTWACTLNWLVTAR